MERKTESAPGIGTVRHMAIETKALGGQNKVLVHHRWCKSCGLCIRFCPRKALAPSKNGKTDCVAQENCSQCGLCAAICPDFAISVAKKSKNGAQSSDEIAEARI